MFNPCDENGRIVAKPTASETDFQGFVEFLGSKKWRDLRPKALALMKTEGDDRAAMAEFLVASGFCDLLAVVAAATAGLARDHVSRRDWWPHPTEDFMNRTTGHLMALFEALADAGSVLGPRAAEDMELRMKLESPTALDSAPPLQTYVRVEADSDEMTAARAWRTFHCIARSREVLAEDMFKSVCSGSPEKAVAAAKIWIGGADVLRDPATGRIYEALESPVWQMVEASARMQTISRFLCYAQSGWLERDLGSKPAPEDSSATAAKAAARLRKAVAVGLDAKGGSALLEAMNSRFFDLTATQTLIPNTSDHDIGFKVGPSKKGWASKSVMADGFLGSAMAAPGGRRVLYAFSSPVPSGDLALVGFANKRSLYFDWEYRIRKTVEKIPSNGSPEVSALVVFPCSVPAADKGARRSLFGFSLADETADAINACHLLGVLTYQDRGYERISLSRVQVGATTPCDLVPSVDIEHNKGQETYEDLLIECAKRFAKMSCGLHADVGYSDLLSQGDGQKLIMAVTRHAKLLEGIIDNDNRDLPSPANSLAKSEIAKAVPWMVTASQMDAAIGMISAPIHQLDCGNFVKCHTIDFLRGEIARGVDPMVAGKVIEASDLRKDTTGWSELLVASDSRNDRIGWPALHWAAFAGARDACGKLLREGADPDGRDKQGWSALHVAAHRTSLEMCKILADLRVPLDTQTKGDGWTPLHFLASNGDRDWVDALSPCELLIGLGANPTIANRNGMTPSMICHSAALKGFLEAAEASWQERDMERTVRKAGKASKRPPKAKSSAPGL